MTETIFLLQGKAPAFVTRNVGKRIREELLEFERQINSTETIVIDASGAESLTPSFVDELFGRTASLMGLQQFQRRFRIRGVNADTKTLINKVVRNRLILDSRARP